MNQVKEKSRVFVNPRRSLFPLIWSYLTNLYYTALICNFISVMIDICALPIHISPIILGCTIAVTPLLVLLFRTIEVKDSKPKHNKIWLLKFSDKIVDWYRKNIKNHWIAKLIWDIVLAVGVTSCLSSLLIFFKISLGLQHVSLISQLSTIGGALFLADQISNYLPKDIEDPHGLIKIAYNALLYTLTSIVTISSLNTGVTVLSVSLVHLGIFVIAIKANYGAHRAAQYNKKQDQADISEYDKAIIKYLAKIRLKKNTNIIIPHSTHSIDEEAFEDFKNLTSITIPNSVVYIGRSAFKNCTILTSITIPDGVTSIGYEAFKGCSNLTYINIPDGVTEIGLSAFVGCCKMHFAIIPTNLESKNEFYWTSRGINLQQTTLITHDQLSSWANNQKLSSTYTYRELAVLYQLQKDDNFTPTWPELGKLASNLLMHDLLIVLPSEKRHIVLPRTYTTQPNSVCLEDHSLFSVVPAKSKPENEQKANHLQKNRFEEYSNPDDPTQTIQLQEVSPAASSAILRWLTLKDMATYLSAKASSRLKPIHPLTTQQARPVLQG